MLLARRDLRYGLISSVNPRHNLSLGYLFRGIDLRSVLPSVVSGRRAKRITNGPLAKDSPHWTLQQYSSEGGLTRSHHNVRIATQEGTGGGMHDKVPIRILLYLWRRLRGDKLTRALSYKAELPSYGVLGGATMLRSAGRAGPQRTLCLRFAWSN